MLSGVCFNKIQRNIDCENNIANNFLVPALSKANRYDSSTCYFSINLLLGLFEGLIPFIKNGGRVRCITSADLSENDLAFFKAAYEKKQEAIVGLIENEISRDLELSNIDLCKLDIITNLIAVGRFDLHIACMKNQANYHEKFGLIGDESDEWIHYIGSANMTYRGGYSNRESIYLSFSWDNADKETVISEREYFNELWKGNDPGVAVFSFPGALERKLFERYKKSDTYEEALNEWNILMGERKSSYNAQEFHPRPYQQKAIDLFLQNNGCFFFEMATGTGKTLTSVQAVKDFISLKNKKFLVVILVPLVDLQDQWKSVLNENGIRTVLVGGHGTDSDKDELISDYYFSDETMYCIAVYKTFFSGFYEELKSIYSEVLLIVDEAHNLSKNNIDILNSISIKYRLGLSATPERYEENESNAILDYFLKPNIKPYVYGLKDAIEAGYLSQYTYHPLFVHLTEDEMQSYEEKSKKIAAMYSDDDMTPEEQRILSGLLSARAQIVKNASGKLDLLKEMVASGEYNFKRSVVYCGRGKSSDSDDKVINLVLEILAEDSSLMVSSFIDKTFNKKSVLEQFDSGVTFTTLVAIKCFDEGIDVPSLERLYILASDGSRRQTIQRRGRVLRVCKETGKDIAYIYDMVVLPPLGVYTNTNMVSTELARVVEYSSLALNKDALEPVIDKMKSRFNIQEGEFECHTEI